MCLQVCRRRTGQGVVFEAEISEHLGGQDVVGQQTQCIARGSNRGHGDGVEVEVDRACGVVTRKKSYLGGF